MLLAISPVAFFCIVWLLNDSFKASRTPSPEALSPKAKARAVAAQDAAVASIQAYQAKMQTLDNTSSPYENM